MSKDVYNKLRTEIEDIPVFDTHEHLIIPGGKDHEDLFYNNPDPYKALVHSAGAPIDIDSNMSEENILDNLVKEMQAIKGQGNLKVLMRGIKEVYGLDLDKLDKKVVKEAATKMFENNKEKKWAKKILKENAKAEIVVLEKSWFYSLWGKEVEDIFSMAFYSDMFLYGYDKNAKTFDQESPFVFADMLGEKIDSFEDYLGFADHVFSILKRNNYITIKIKIAKIRTLDIADIKEKRAKQIFDKESKKITLEDIKDFQDFMLNYIIKRCIKYDIPIQIHTGMSPRHDFRGASPINLINTFSRYPDARFSILHSGYPWTSETASLLFCYPNVTTDLCWLELISQEIMESHLCELIEITGGKKITLGGDTFLPEAACGALAISKDVIARSLSRMIDREYIKFEDAIAIAENILYKNSRDIFKT